MAKRVTGSSASTIGPIPSATKAYTDGQTPKPLANVRCTFLWFALASSKTREERSRGSLTQ
jgi:hypothetical protein